MQKLLQLNVSRLSANSCLYDGAVVQFYHTVKITNLQEAS